jgi:hypothetical protein
MLLLQVSKAHFPNTQLGCATLFPPCKKTAVGSDFGDAEIAGLQKLRRTQRKISGKDSPPKNRRKEEEKPNNINNGYVCKLCNHPTKCTRHQQQKEQQQQQLFNNDNNYNNQWVVSI